ncbi:MAG: hypothetical protein NZ578_13525 [Candidatus Binatia bacterium]|nr:hypothetical protein [Candidatus Binatia bacterium]
MKKGLAVTLGLLLAVFVATQADAHGWRGGRSGLGYWHGGRVSTRAGLGFHRSFGHRHFGHHHTFRHPPRFAPSHRHRFHSHRKFVPRHHFHLHLSPTPFFTLAPHSGFAFHSFGVPFGFGVRTFSTFSSTRTFGAAGFPPLGAAGLAPLSGTGPLPVVISSPFFCFPHRLSFTEEALFIDHLHRIHRLPRHRALLYCRPVGGVRYIFFGF